MRALLISGSLPPMKCGVGDYTALLARGLGEHAGIATAVLTSAAAAPGDLGRGVEVWPRIRSWGPGAVGEVRRALREWRPDLVHLQYPTRGYGHNILPYWLPVLLRAMGLPVVQTWHEPLQPPRTLLRYLLGATTRDTLIVVEPEYEQTLPGWFRRLMRGKRQHWIPVGSSVPAVMPSAAEQHAIRARFHALDRRLIAYFGFAMPQKGIEQLFRIADPRRDRLALICDLDPANAYQRAIGQQVAGAEWRGRAFVTGYLPALEVARILATADAVVFPFTTGVAYRNTSFWAARNQGTFVLTTSRTRAGYDAAENTCYTRPGAISDLKAALETYAGRRAATPRPGADWPTIAGEHLRVYREALGGGR